MYPRLFQRTLTYLFIFLLASACQPASPAGMVEAVESTVTQAVTQLPASPATAIQTPPAAPQASATPTGSPAANATTPTPAPAASATLANANVAENGPACGYSPSVAGLLAQTSAEDWLGWVKRLSGAEPVMVGGQELTITTRHSVQMFSGQPHARAFDYVKEQVLGWYPPEQVDTQRYGFIGEKERLYTWYNLILTLPGQTRPDEIVILSAHLDSAAQEHPETIAPGAEDNASGSAALLEAARILQGQRFERTIQIIWFTGEEQGLRGSQMFVEQRIADPSKVVGVVNLDMFGYDPNNDGCFELHVGQLPASQVVGECFTQALEAYQPDLPYDYLVEQAIYGSDHASFWRAGIGAVEVLENLFDHTRLPGMGCPDQEMNPYYHTAEDTYDKLNPETGIAIVRAALATVLGLAKPLP